MSKYVDIVERDTYPNGNIWYKIKSQFRMIGSYKPVDDGFLVNGKRKPVKTEDEAVRQILSKRLQELEREQQYLKELLAR